MSWIRAPMPSEWKKSKTLSFHRSLSCLVPFGTLSKREVLVNYHSQATNIYTGSDVGGTKLKLDAGVKRLAL